VISLLVYKLNWRLFFFFFYLTYTLYSGQQKTALDGIDMLAKLQKRAKDSIIIMPGCGKYLIGWCTIDYTNSTLTVSKASTNILSVTSCNMLNLRKSTYPH
jgi:copper homeostasis protein CutC